MRGREESLARELAEQKALVASEHERAATKVQAAARGHLGRARVLADMEQREHCAVFGLLQQEQVGDGAFRTAMHSCVLFLFLFLLFFFFFLVLFLFWFLFFFLFLLFLFLR